MAERQMQAIYADVKSRFPSVSNGGIQVCRKIDGSDRWSEHAWGNAVDIMVPDRATGDRVYDYLALNPATVVKHRIGRVCWRDRRSPLVGGGCDPADHQDHVHVEGLIDHYGQTPPCAGGNPITNAITAGVDVPDVPVISDVASFLTALGRPQTWLRVLWFGLGTAATVAGVAVFVGELTGVRATNLVPVGRLTSMVRGR